MSIEDLVEKNWSRYSPEYIQYIKDIHNNIREIKKNMEENHGWNDVCIEPNCMTFEEWKKENNK